MLNVEFFLYGMFDLPFICLDITECFSSGCDVIDDLCTCGYSNSCPTRNFAFGDLLSCETSLLENSTETEGIYE